MKLVSAAPSPFARKVRIALAEKGIPFELVTEVPWNAGSQAARLNPLGKVPVLILDDGHVLFDSRFILEYLELKQIGPSLLPDDTEELLATKRIEVLTDGVCDAVVLMVLERTRAPQRQSEAWIARQRVKVDAGVKAVAASVAGNPWALGAQFGLADIAIGAMLGYLDVRLPEMRWRGMYPELAALFDRFMERASFRNTAPEAQVIDNEAVA